MKDGSIRNDVRVAVPDRVAHPPRPRHTKLALVRPVVAPVDEYVPAPADPRDSFESAALAVMREFQRASFYR